MTNLEDMLERAAGSAPVRFSTEDVRRRVRRRSRVRRTGTAMAVVPVLVIGGWWGTAELFDDPAERVEVADGGGDTGIDGGLEGRWTPVAYSAVTVGSMLDPYVEFVEGGSLRGDDGCTSFTASWTVRGDRLIIEGFEEGPPVCDLPSDTMLIEILRDNPTVGPPGLVPGSLELRSARGFVTFERAVDDPPRTLDEAAAEAESRMTPEAKAAWAAVYDKAEVCAKEKGVDKKLDGLRDIEHFTTDEMRTIMPCFEALMEEAEAADALMIPAEPPAER